MLDFSWSLEMCRGKKLCYSNLENMEKKVLRLIEKKTCNSFDFVQSFNDFLRYVWGSRGHSKGKTKINKNAAVDSNSGVAATGGLLQSG